MKVLITGDFAPTTARLRSLLHSGNFESVFRDFRLKAEDHDINITNLEAPITTHKERIRKVGPHLKTTLDAAKALNWAGFNLVTLANNHILDYGVDGLIDTLNACNHNEIAVVGAGKNLEDAAVPYYFEKEETSIAILNVCEEEFNIDRQSGAGVNSIDLIRNYHQIKQAREKADYIITIIHGGHEYYNLPSPKRQALFRHYIELGSHVVIGHHPHFHSGYEEYNGGIIFYSLGNFLFDAESYKPEAWYKGYGVSLTFNKGGKIDFSIIPYEQCGSQIGINTLSTRQVEQFREELNVLNQIVQNEELLNQRWSDFINEKRKKYLCRLLPMRNRYIDAFFYKLNLPLPFSRNAKLRILNSIRCMSHREIFISAIEKSL